MTSLSRIVAAHPLARSKPYNAIKFAGVDRNGVALYTVSTDRTPIGARRALKLAVERLGANCFHCRVWMPPQPLSQDCTLDHLRPQCDGGNDDLHNLVFACGKCNHDKGSDDIVQFRPRAAMEYLRALDDHLARCLKQLGGN